MKIRRRPLNSYGNRKVVPSERWKAAGKRPIQSEEDYNHLHYSVSLSRVKWASKILYTPTLTSKTSPKINQTSTQFITSKIETQPRTSKRKYFNINF